MATGNPKAIITHAQRVCRLYKKSLRTLEWHSRDRAVFRYAAVLMRDRFDKTRQEKDMRKLAAMVEQGEEECFKNQHFQPFTFKNDPGGILYQRYHLAEDRYLDIWHPWEKVLYKNYFDTREQRKLEVDAYYESSFPKKGTKDLDSSEYPVRGPHV